MVTSELYELVDHLINYKWEISKKISSIAVDDTDNFDWYMPSGMRFRMG